jgi:hypothetical protein
MKKLSLLTIALSGVLIGCAFETKKSGGPRSIGSTEDGRTQISLTGTQGTVVKGFYVQNGQRFEISNSVPWNLDSSGVSQLEIRKADAADTVIVDMQYDNSPTYVKRSEILGPGVRWIKVQVRNGFTTKTYSR